MFWAVRRFRHDDFGPYQDQIGGLQLKYPLMQTQFVMVSVRVAGDPTFSDYYIGVPLRSLLATFDGFDEITELDLPKIIDNAQLFTDDEQFNSRFTFKRG